MQEQVLGMTLLIIMINIFQYRPIYLNLGLLRKEKVKTCMFVLVVKNYFDLCIQANMNILNGKTFGDKLGKYTSFQYNGNSIVDYCIVWKGI